MHGEAFGDIRDNERRSHQKILQLSFVGGTAPPSVLPDISPSRGEIGCRIRFRHSPALQKKRGMKAANLPP
ncbi:hypothetical protein FJ980_16565 [Mesorhizobium sp. B1-1-5]|nr:hypothetical protein FJ980_16565 [Mesorhizobium sp. B1-1-5]